jgi:group I intron endonuclease
LTENNKSYTTRQHLVKIYILENKINNKCYVGQTINFKSRLRQHKYSNSFVGKAIKKYGIKNFGVILIENIEENKLDELEAEYIKKYNSILPNGYNCDTGGHKNKHQLEETKRKISEKNKGKLKGRISPMKGKIPWNKGKNYSLKQKKIFTEEHKNRISIALLGNKNKLGKIKIKIT